jgi:ribosomal protein S28E/S33
VAHNFFILCVYLYGGGGVSDTLINRDVQLILAPGKDMIRLIVRNENGPVSSSPQIVFIFTFVRKKYISKRRKCIFLHTFVLMSN